MSIVVIGGELQNRIKSVLNVGFFHSSTGEFSYSRETILSLLSDPNSEIYAYANRAALEDAAQAETLPEPTIFIKKERDPEQEDYMHSEYIRPVFYVELKEGIEVAGNSSVKIQYSDIEKITAVEFPGSNRKDIDFTTPEDKCTIM